MRDRWPFRDPANTAVITTRRVVQELEPILLVTHDEDDGSWQFLDGNVVDEADALVVGLRYVAQIDPSILELADLPIGWVASRTSAGTPWSRGARSEASIG